MAFSGGRMVTQNQRLVVALDNMSGEAALTLAQTLEPLGVTFKVGMELFYREGYALVDTLQRLGASVFVDLKLHDIPNTVEKTSEVLVSRGVSFFNVHAQGGPAMLKAAGVGAMRAAEACGMQEPLILAVTVLTSISQEMLNDTLKFKGTVEDYALYLAEMTMNAGLDGVVCSPHEARRIRQHCGPGFVILTPGIRPANYDVTDDQARVMTAGEAIAAGANFVVVGRPITQAKNPLAVAESLLGEMAAATPPTRLTAKSAGFGE